MSSGCFKINGNMITLTVLELHRYHPEDFIAQLRDTVNQSPKFFEKTPVLVSLEKLASPDETPDLRALAADCKAAGVQVIAYRGSNAFREVVTDAGFSLVLAPASARDERKLKQASTPKMQPKPDVVGMNESGQGKEDGAQRPSKIITQTVRSGQQIYAQGGDLIVLGSVSGGAELLADGNIHVYNALRGRALAGIGGDAGARIFCHSLQAELVSVAGVYATSEEFPADLHQQSVQVYLKGGKLQIRPL